MNWSIVSLDKKDGGLGIRKLSALSKVPFLGNGIGDLLLIMSLFGNK